MTNDLTTEAAQQDTVYALAQSANNLYAARLSGLYRSQDGGQSWRNTFASLPQPLAATAVTAVGNTVFAGVNGAVLRSDDAGENWHLAGLSSPAPHVVALAVSPNFGQDGIIIAGTADDGVFVSNDKGMNWAAWNFGLLDLHIFALAVSPDFSQDRTIYAGTESGIFRSQNGGRGWREVPFPMDIAPAQCVVLSPTYITDGRLFAGTEKNGLFVSDNFGLNWRSINIVLITTDASAIQLITSPSGELWLLLEDQVLCSPDSGQSWIQRHQFPSDKLAMAMLVSATPSDPILVGFADGSILQLR